MSIVDLRLQYKSDSGMISLSDPQIDTYINRGIKFLDKNLFSPQKDSRLFLSVKNGDNAIVLPAQARAIKDIWISLSTSNHRHQLGKLSLEDIRNPERRYYWYQYWYSVYFFDTFSTQDSPGRPRFYCPVPGHGLASDATIDKQSFFCNLGDITLDQGASRVVTLWPIADQDYSIEVFGNFFSPQLSDSITDNWWSLNHPELVIMAALYCQDRTYRNTSGGQELGQHIQSDLRSLNDDAIEEESMSAEDSRMEG